MQHPPALILHRQATKGQFLKNLVRVNRTMPVSPVHCHTALEMLCPADMMYLAALIIVQAVDESFLPVCRDNGPAQPFHLFSLWQHLKARNTRLAADFDEIEMKASIFAQEVKSSCRSAT